MLNAISLVQDLNSSRRVHFPTDNDYTTGTSLDVYKVLLKVYSLTKILSRNMTKSDLFSIIIIIIIIIIIT